MKAILTLVLALATSPALATADDEWLVHGKLQAHHVGYFGAAAMRDGTSLWISKEPCAVKEYREDWLHGVQVTPDKSRVVELCWKPDKTKKGTRYVHWCPVRGNYKAVTGWCLDAPMDGFDDVVGYVPRLRGDVVAPF